MDTRKRTNVFIDKQFQTKFIVKFSLIVICSSLLIGVLLFLLSMNFTTVAIDNTRVTVKSMSDFMLPMICLVVPLVALFSAISVMLLTLYTSHKIAGPLYRLTRDIETFKNGDLKTRFGTRKSDQLQQLAASLSEMGLTFSEKHTALAKKTSELKDCLARPDSDRNALTSKITELEQLLKYFKL